MTRPAAGDATVHLRLRGTIGEPEMTCLRQQLAACLHSGVHDIRIHAEEQADLDIAVLQALHGVQCYLTKAGGNILLIGAQPRVLSKIAMRGLEHLLADAPADVRRAPTSVVGDAAATSPP